MRRPNFFILGAPKCGTTSLANWLRQHPQVFFSTPKEPFFFCPDIHPSTCSTLVEYAELFRDAREEHRAVGEGSTAYLLSAVAVPRIVDYQPDARFIVMLRPPLEMALSLHSELLFQLHEDIDDFAFAWRAQESRRRGERIPRSCLAPALLQYGEVCRLGRQIDRLHRSVGNRRVKTILLEDMRSDPAAVWKEVAGFLDIPSHPLPKFAVSNRRKQLRIRKLKDLLHTGREIVQRRGLQIPMGIMSSVHRWNELPAEKPGLPGELREELREYFAEDVHWLGDLLGRDLKHWLQ